MKSQMAPWVQEFISKSPFCVLAASDANGNCDASSESGTPRFVKVLNDRFFIRKLKQRQSLLPHDRILAVLLSLRIRRKLPFV